MVYISFNESKSKNYKKAKSLADRFPLVSSWNGKTECSIEDIKEFIKIQDVVFELICIIIKWRNSTIVLNKKHCSSLGEYYLFLKNIRENSGKYSVLIRDVGKENVSLGAITYEDLPLPIVYYPEHYGAFFGFAEDVGEKIFFCECERKAIEDYIKLRKNHPLENYTGSKTYPLGSDFFPKTVAEISKTHKENPLSLFGFKQKLCFRCNNKIPTMKYCHPMYGGVFKQRYGWYIEQEEMKLGIDPYQISQMNILPDECSPEIYDYIKRMASIVDSNTCSHDVMFLKEYKQYKNALENIVREQLGYPKIGDCWISETMLFHIVERLFSTYEIKRHYRPEWLEGLELDIYLPERRIAFEYQGIQHFRAVEHWGGEAQLEKQKEHDRRKKSICEERKINLICINYDEELTDEHIANRIVSSGEVLDD